MSTGYFAHPRYSFCGHFLNPKYNIYENTSESGTRRSFKNGRLLEEIYNFKFLLDEQILEYQQENVCLVIKSAIIFTMIIYYNAFPFVAISSFWLPSAVHLSKKINPRVKENNFSRSWHKFFFPCFFVGDPGAREMTWMQVPGEKLLEPVVNLVITSQFFHQNAYSPYCSLYIS